MPCKDVHASQRGESPVISVEAHSDNQHSSIKDSCSPFCVCCCCSTPTVITQTLLTSTVSLIINKKYSDIAPGHIASNDPSVWQPPKLG